MVSPNAVFLDTSYNYFGVNPDTSRQPIDALIQESLGKPPVIETMATMEPMRMPLYKRRGAALNESLSLEACVLIDVWMEKSPTLKDEPVVTDVPLSDAPVVAASCSSAVKHRRRSPIVEVTIDSDNDGHERETVLAGHVHIEENEGVSMTSDISCDDESETEFFRLCSDGDDNAIEDCGDEISIGAFIEFLSVEENEND